MRYRFRQHPFLITFLIVAIMVFSSSYATYRYTSSKFTQFESVRVELALNLQYDTCVATRSRLDIRNHDMHALLVVLRLPPTLIRPLSVPHCVKPPGYRPIIPIK